MKRILCLVICLVGASFLSACQSVTAAEFAELEEEKASVEQENEQLEQEAVRLRERVEDLENRNRGLQQALTELRQDVESIRRRRASGPSPEVEVPEDLEDEVEKIEVGGRPGLRPLERVLFESGSAELTEEGEEAIDHLAEVLKTVEDQATFRVAGHTDNQPIQEVAEEFPTNWHLSIARATAVAMHLIDRGIEEQRLEIVGHGETRPIATNDNEEGRAQNRRVEVVILP